MRCATHLRTSGYLNRVLTSLTCSQVRCRDAWAQIRTPGNDLALGALLLMARDPGSVSTVPRSRGQEVARTGGSRSANPSAPPSDRYGALLSFLDEVLREAASEFDYRSVIRLDAQGLMWT